MFENGLFSGSFIVLYVIICFAIDSNNAYNKNIPELNQKYHLRQKRYLYFPNGGPARFQFNVGVGVPVDLKEQSVTVGLVFKPFYNLPINDTLYLQRIYGSVQTVGRLKGDKIHMDEKKQIDDQKDTNNNDEDDDYDDDEDDEPLVEIDFDRENIETSDDIDDSDKVDKRDIIDTENKNSRIAVKRSMPKNSLGNFKAENEITLEEAIERQEQNDENANLDDPEPTNRWSLYRILEMLTGRYGGTGDGRACMLRAVCEAAQLPFTHHSGLLGELLHILLTPSATRDPVSQHSDNEYHAAERLGRTAPNACEHLFADCDSSPLEIFTSIDLGSLF